MDNKEKISIIIATFNRKGLLQKALDSLFVQGTDNLFSFEIIVIDNGSKDGTIEYLEGLSKNVEVPFSFYYYDHDSGIPAARNFGVSKSNSKWIAFTDDDQFMEKNWLKELYIASKRYNADCVGGIRYLLLPGSIDRELPKMARLLLGEMLFKGQIASPIRNMYPNTGNSLVKKSLFDDVGKFYENEKFKGEDLDFFRRVRIAGFNVHQTSKAAVHHIISQDRLTKDYLKIAARRSGINYAIMDIREFGILHSAIVGIIRVYYIVLLLLPKKILSNILRNEKDKEEQSIRIEISFSYIKKVLHAFFPNHFIKKDFIESLNYRNTNSRQS